MSNPTPRGRAPTALSLELVLAQLLEDGLISQAQHNQLRGKAGPLRKQGEHPLVSVAAMNWQSPGEPPQALALEPLTRWLALRNAMEYLHIDPLKTDFSKLTHLVSYAYASRFSILPIAADDTSATIAVADPYVREWEADLRHVLKKDIRRVLINPLDLQRYLHEFYSLHYSVQGAGQDKRYARPAPCTE